MRSTVITTIFCLLIHLCAFANEGNSTTISNDIINDLFVDFEINITDFPDLLNPSTQIIGADSSGGGRIAPSAIRLQFDQPFSTDGQSAFTGIFEIVLDDALHGKVTSIFWKDNSQSLNFCVQVDDWSNARILFEEIVGFSNNLTVKASMISNCYEGSLSKF